MRRFSPLAALFCLIFLTACTAQADSKEEKNAAAAAMEESSAKEEQTAVFQAAVLEASESDCLVEPVEGSAERKSADRIRIFTDGLSDDAPMPGIGDVIEITYDGWIAETYPAQISHVSEIRILTPASDTDEISDENEDNGTEIIEGEIQR